VKGFTLPELMVVVAIMAILTGVALPFALGRLHEAQRAAPRLEQASPSFESAGLRQPTTESSDFHVELRARQEIEGWQVRTRYHARVEAVYVIRNQDGRSLSLAFPFPAGMTEARSVSLARKSGDVWLEPADVTYDLGAIRWKGEVEPFGTVTLRIAYESEGRDAFVYDVAGSGRTGAVHAEVILDGVERPVVPPWSLAPTEVAPGRLAWSFEHLVTNERIRVELPPGPSPLGRLVLLCQLAALAVLLFGIGFWYLNELDRPGRLDTFRWGHFLLLAGNHSLFFAVVAFAGDPRWGVAAGAAVSLPLLYVHVSRVAGERFALRRVLPLAALTLVLVVAAVYAPASRPFLALASGSLGAAFVTLTYRNFSAGRAAYFAERLREYQRQKLLPLIDEALASIEDLDDMTALRADAERLKQDPTPRAIERLKKQVAEALKETEERRARAYTPPAGRHCPSCGLPAGNKHCAFCGTEQPLPRTCKRCGDETRLPVHLLRPTALAAPIHCGRCGGRLD
jgi:prepilin-type N-terminal cleavage/methylation domain-containing protein